MDQETLGEKLSMLERKLKLLLVDHQRTQQEVELLRKENIELKSVVRTKEDQLENFKNKINISKIVNSATVDESESAELKHTLSDYIKKIDLCIAHLSD